MFFHRKDSSLGKLMDPAVVVKLVPGLSNLQPYWMLLARTTLCYPGHRIVHNFSYTQGCLDPSCILDITVVSK
jgi:hypothetical protein